MTIDPKAFAEWVLAVVEKVPEVAAMPETSALLRSLEWSDVRVYDDGPGYRDEIAHCPICGEAGRHREKPADPLDAGSPSVLDCRLAAVLR